VLEIESVREEHTARGGYESARSRNMETVSQLELKMSSYIYFGSGTKVGELSNFARCPTPFEWEGHLWNSSESAYCCWLRVDPVDWPRFAVGGDLSELTTGFAALVPASVVGKKVKHYGSKKGGTKPEMIGIIPKLATKDKYAKKIGVRLTPRDEAKCEPSELFNKFVEILVEKYRYNKTFRDVLIATRGKKLIEFDRGAVRESKKGKPPFWTAQVQEGVMYGRNFQGDIQEAVRHRFL